MTKKTKEFREHQRYSCDLPVKIITENTNLDGIAINISFGGVLIVIDNNQNIDLSGTVKICFKFPFTIYDTVIPSKICWNNKTNIGAQFIGGLNTNNIDDLRLFIDSLLDIEDRREEKLIQSRNAINTLLETTLSELSLEKQLEVALEIILSVSWCSFEYKGAIFLFDKNEQSLVMKASINIPDLQMLCGKVSIGQCLCGRTAEFKNVIFNNHFDKEYTTTYDGMKHHSHYCVPILENSELLGVLNIYVPDGHIDDKDEKNFRNCPGTALQKELDTAI